MFALYVVAFFCWMSVGHSDPPDCGKLLQPLGQVDLNHLEGRWALIGGSMSNQTQLDKFKTRDSASIIIASHSDSTKVSLTRVFSFDGTCQYMKSNITLQENGFSFEELNVSVTVLQTSCKDCLVVQFNDESRGAMRFYMFSKKREVDQKDKDEFEAQAKCLTLIEPVWMNSTKPLCPDEIAIDAGAQTE